MGRILSIDYGEKRIGLAVSDELKITSQPYDTIVNKDIETSIQQITQILKKMDVEKIVIGMPRNLKGSKGKQAEIVENFGKKLEENILIPIEYLDEWFTSKEAKNILIKSKVKTGKNKDKVDKLSAQIILKSYLDSIPES